MPRNIGYAASDAKSPLEPYRFDRRATGPQDVRIDITHCGVCHSDVHQGRDEFGGALVTLWPCLPGHEIVGVVTEVGDRVTKHAIDFGAVSMNRITVAGPLIGSITETQEVLEFCAEHQISADVEVIDNADANEAFDHMVYEDVRFRFVIDNATLEVLR